MSEEPNTISKGRSRLALGLLLLIDGLTFIGLEDQGGRTSVHLAASTFPLVLLAIDGLLSFGLFTARRWALELARYRCILGVCYLAFLWISFFMVLDHAEAMAFSSIMTVGAVRDSLIGFLLIAVLFLIREQKQPVIPKGEVDPGTDPAEDDPAEDDAPGQPEPPQE